MNNQNQSNNNNAAGAPPQQPNPFMTPPRRSNAIAMGTPGSAMSNYQARVMINQQAVDGLNQLAGQLCQTLEVVSTTLAPDVREPEWGHVPDVDGVPNDVVVPVGGGQSTSGARALLLPPSASGTPNGVAPGHSAGPSSTPSGGSATSGGSVVAPPVPSRSAPSGGSSSTPATRGVPVVAPPAPSTSATIGGAAVVAPPAPSRSAPSGGSSSTSATREAPVVAPPAPSTSATIGGAAVVAPPAPSTARSGGARRGPTIVFGSPDNRSLPPFNFRSPNNGVALPPVYTTPSGQTTNSSGMTPESTSPMDYSPTYP